MPVPFPHQIVGARFLAERQAALLADAPRVGKTGTSIMACDYVLARKVLVVTKASARANWGREFREWGFPRKIQVVYSAKERVREDADVVVVGWPVVFDKSLLAQIADRQWCVLILDESHEAKNPDAKRTHAVYHVLAPNADRVWCLSGTPAANAPNDLYPMLEALAPERIGDISSYHHFVRRYCTVKPRWLGGRKIEVITGGKNMDELRQRLDGFWLRRTQQDVGIVRPIFSMFTVHADKLPSEMRDIDERADEIIDAAERGDTKQLEMHLGPLRRVTGLLKAHAVVEAMREELEDGLDKIVLMAWHKDVMQALRDGLSAYGVSGIAGDTPASARQRQVDEFQRGSARVFVGQIQAAGEAIDLSSSANLMFVESSFTPMHMAQAALRITNHSQSRQTLVRVAALEGSIDEALQSIVLRKVAAIKQLNGD